MAPETSPTLGRALSPVPARGALLGLLFFLVAERGWGSTDEQPLLYPLLLGVLLIAAAALQLVFRRGAQPAVRGYGRAVVLALVGLLFGDVLYALSKTWAANEQPEQAGYALVASVAVFFLHALLLLAVEITGIPMRAAGFVELRRVKQAAATAAMIAFAVTSLGMLNVAIYKKDARWDLSLSTRTKPSDATVLMLGGGDPVEAFLFFEKGSPVLTQVGDYFDAIKEKGATVQILDQALDADLAKELKVSRNGTIALRRGERSESWFVGTDRDAARRKLAKLDDEMRKRLSKLTRDAQLIYFTTGHGELSERAAKPGERPAGSGLAKIAKSANAKVKKLGVAEGLSTRVPEDADVVVVAGPTSRFLPAEVEALKAYVETGGSLLLLLDPGSDHGLEAVVSALGLVLEDIPLVNTKEFVRRTHTDADHEFLFAASFASHKAVKALNDARGRVALLFLRAGALVRAKGGGESKPKVTFIARSRKDTFADADGDRKFDDAEKREVKNFAAAVERPTAGEDTRALVVADSDVLADALISAEANAAFGYQGLLWLMRDDTIAGAYESDEDAPIVHTSDDDSLWFYGTSLVVPGLILVFGLSIVRRRKKRGTR